MMSKRHVAKLGFILTTILLSVLVTYLACLRTKTVYKAQIHFQIATAKNSPKPNLETEKQLILSQSLLMQVLRDINLLPEISSGFRSFELGSYQKKLSHKAEIIDGFRRNLEVEIYPDNAAISIIYKSLDANEARKVTETVFEKYRDWRQGNKTSGFDQKMIDADKNLAQKREAFLESQKRFLDYAEGQTGSNPDLVNLKNQKIELSAKIESLKLRYGLKHPALIEALRQQEVFNAQLENNVDKKRLKILRDEMSRNFQALDSAIRMSVALEQEVGRNSPFEILALGETEVQTLPQYLLYKLLAASIAGFLLSLLYLKIRSKIRPVFYNNNDLQSIFGISVLEKIPGLLNERYKETSAPTGVTADALKALRQELRLLSTEDQPIKLVTITSSWPEEGRSELVAGLGRVAARAGEKVLILDADLRLPSLQKTLPSMAIRNLVDYLSGQVRVEDIIARTDPSGVHVIYGTAIPNTALDLISSEKMKTLLHSLREVYDLVLVQAPVALRGPDARILAALSDYSLYLVEGRKTLSSDVKSGVDPFIVNSISRLSFVIV